MRPPSIDALARELADTGLPHGLLVDVARAAVADGDPASARSRAEAVRTALLQPVINATGVLLHTNLGRAPIVAQTDGRASNLELDLRTGRRGSRGAHVGRLVAAATGAEAVLVVNNGAAAILLVLSTIAKGRAVVVSRGELVEIGGGFRLPDVLRESGAHLVEVGTTNRTHRRDYVEAVTAHDPAVVLKVHPSNFRIEGFTAEVGVAALSELGPPVVVDAGSGLLDERAPWLAGPAPAWLRGEPGVRQLLAAGAALVTFSGDKLLGGPQAGLIAGRRDLVERCAAHPLARALRPGGLVLAALQDVVSAHLHRDPASIPFWRMVTAPVEELRERARRIVARSGRGAVVETEAAAGAGSLPGREVPSAGVAVAGDHTGSLRTHSPPVIARVSAGSTILDLRAVDPADDDVLVAALRHL